MSNNKENIDLAKRSGNIFYNSKLVAFLYLLMRDELSTGRVENIVRNIKDSSYNDYTNGWLAKYAKDLADRLENE